MKNVSVFIEKMYKCFNDRNVDEIIANIDENVKWANAMEGNFVYGHDGVRSYWTRQFEMISSKVRPLEIVEVDGVIKVKVHQVVHDLNGVLLSDQIRDHYFRLQGDKIVEFGIRNNQIKEDNGEQGDAE